MYNRYVCEVCGAHLDPSEDCDCKRERKRNHKMRQKCYNDIFEYARELEEKNERITV